MADTLNFGPEWLRALSDGNSVKSPPALGSCGKFKLADKRYSREEMLALFSTDCKIPEPVRKLPPVFVDKAQPPLSLMSLSEEEQRLISTSVNSQAVLRIFGRGGPPTRGGRGAGIERGRGRGRGRGEGFPTRTSYEEGEGGGFGRPRGLPKNDAWEEVGQKRFDRVFSGQHDEGPHRKEFMRSNSSDNWRDREREQEQEIDNDGDWRRAGGSKWSTRTSWRDPVTSREKGVFENTWQNSHQKVPFNKERNRQFQRSRTSESWEDEENMPEWSIPDSDELEEVGTFDSSGAFVSNKTERERVDIQPEVPLQETTVEAEPPVIKQPVSCSTKDNSNKKAKTKNKENPQTVNNVCTDIENHTKNDRHEQAADLPKPKHVPLHEGAPGMPSKTKHGKSELETAALSQMKETVESMVAQMTAEDEEKTVCSALPMDHENAMKWFYRDPQGDLQGPFTASEMAEWFSAGYFTMNLMVKRGCDEKFSPLGELIKHWSRVPFVPGPPMPPLLSNPVPQPSIPVNQSQEQIKLLQQQFMIQQQIMTQQLLRQMQMQQIQQMMSHLQEEERFKSLSLAQQQQLAMQCLMGQQLPGAAKTSQSPPNETVVGSLSAAPPPSFHRSHSQPANISQEQTEEMSVWNMPHSANSGNLSLPTSVWDLDNQPSNQEIPSDILAQMEEVRKKQEMERQKREEEENMKLQELQQQQENLRRQHEELLQQKEAIERERAEMEKLEQQRLEEARQKEEKRKFTEEKELKRQQMEKIRQQQEEQQQLRKQQEEQQQRRFEEEQESRRKREEESKRQREDEIRRQQEEEMRLKHEEKLRKEEQRRKQELLRQEELSKQEEEREYQRQEELRREEEMRRQEMEKQKQMEMQKSQEMQRQQQEALRKLQQEQLAKLQLPAHAQWGSQTHQNPQQQQNQPAMSLLQIQKQEEHTRQQEEEFQRQVEIQRQQMLAIQEEQQQQKTWAAQRSSAVRPSTKSLLEIQEEQANQLEKEKSYTKETKQHQAKNVNSSVPVWNSTTNSGSGWASEGTWSSLALSSNINQTNNNSSQSLGFWDDVAQSSSKKSNKSGNNTPNSEFPSLGKSIRTNTGTSVIKQQMKPSRSNKDEAAAQRLFQTSKPTDNFTQWCTDSLKNLATSVDIPTFVAFLQEVESPYEVHDYVRSYLGESKAARDFGKQFLEKRSKFNGRGRSHTQESSMPSLAEAFAQPTYKQPQQFTEQESHKSKGKKKKKMTKVDSSVLGFTVHAAPDRINIGEIEQLDGH